MDSIFRVHKCYAILRGSRSTARLKEPGGQVPDGQLTKRITARLIRARRTSARQRQLPDEKMLDVDIYVECLDIFGVIRNGKL